MDHHLVLPLLVYLLGFRLRAINVGTRGIEPAEDPEGGDEGEHDEAEQRTGLQRHGHGGPAAEAAEVGAHLAPRHLPVALARQVHHLRRRGARRKQQVSSRLIQDENKPVVASEGFEGRQQDGDHGVSSCNGVDDNQISETRKNALFIVQ